MKKNNIPETIGVIVSLAGIVVMTGWYLDITMLKSILPFWVSMKFSTALSFLLSGIVLYFTARFQKQSRDLALVILPVASMIIMLPMASLLASTMIGVNAGVEEMFVKDSTTAVQSVTPGRPSVATMINFVLIASAGIIVSFHLNIFNKVLTAIGLAVGLIGITAVFGYILNQPWLYFAVRGKSSAMALHTAILFVLWAWGAILTGRYK